jgi:hypothetical protein
MDNNDWFLRFYDTQLRWALKHLTCSEYKVFTYMISIIVKSKITNHGFKNGREVYEMYQQGYLLPVNTSHDTIAKNCSLNIKTVRRALDRFEEMGIMLRISKKSYGVNNIYIVGMRNGWHREDMKRSEYLFIDTIFLQRGEKIPDDIKDFIIKNRRNRVALFNQKIIEKKTLPEIFFPA